MRLHVERVTDREQHQLCHEVGISLPDLFDRPGFRVCGVASADVLVLLDFGHDVHGRKLADDVQPASFGLVGHLDIDRHVVGYGRRFDDQLEVVLDRLGLPRDERLFQPVDFGIGPRGVRLVCLRAILVTPLSLRQRLLPCLLLVRVNPAGVLVVDLALLDELLVLLRSTEHLRHQASWFGRGELSPLGWRDRVCDLAGLERRERRVDPQRVEGDLSIAEDSVGQDGLERGDSVLHRGRQSGSLVGLILDVLRFERLLELGLGASSLLVMPLLLADRLIDQALVLTLGTSLLTLPLVLLVLQFGEEAAFPSGHAT
ncbi:hypothetical protein [Lentzea indica]|uniref:hypothetical protein n=1 Tax=Lentzea indica TaxID=2604800 RepID=UPI001FE2585A|nr:hypothetical protein [Lentzea indica]